MKKFEKIPGSFRDPDGYVFLNEQSIYRCINKNYQENYEQLISSGLYKKLTEEKLLIPHQEIDQPQLLPQDAFKVIQPELIPFISYPYEWCFSQLKQAALTTLKIQKIAMRFAMSLKDCSAYNIQFKHNQAILIDTLSFEKYNPSQPWPAYKQFCQYFLSPLALISCKDVRLSQLLKTFIDGIPLDLASRLLPKSSYLNLGLFLHIHLHAKFQKNVSNKKFPSCLKPNQLGLMGMLEQLETTIKKLRFKPKSNHWNNYYQNNSYSKTAFAHKQEIVKEFLEQIKPRTIWDLGANKGIFSLLASKQSHWVIALDSEPELIEQIFLNCQKTGISNILPLVLDLSNPSPDIGWENKERISLLKRGPAQTIMALALIHHLAISHNLPLDKIAEFFAANCTWLIIEFIPKTDSQSQKLLRNRKDIFTDYNKINFEKTFSDFLKIHSQTDIKDTERTIYLMEKLK
ncbi:MAG: SAM-dependent methyltransferase [Candidatus Omnitrophica bacterium]|nr:SAM-dependent methyltransferase [Candidatus Omnitrophota bacterium]